MAGNIPITGLTMLGQTLLNAGTDYAAEKRKTADEQRLRSEHLSDVASQRQYEQQNFDKVRAIQLSDEQRRRIEAVDDLKTRAALEARFKLLNEAQARGLIDAGSLGNQSLEDAAIHAISQQLAKESSFQQEQPANAAARLAELGQSEQLLTRKLAEVESRLSAQPTIDQAAVQRAAIEMATQMNAGKPPSREQIQQAYPDALAKAQQQATLEWYQTKSDAQIQQQLLTSQLNTIRAQQANLTSTFKVAPTASPLVQAPPATPAATSAPASGGGLQGFLQQLNASTPQPAPSSGSSLTLGDVSAAMQSAPPSAIPQLRQTRTNLLADQYANLDDPMLNTQAKLADVQQKLARVQSGQNPFQGVTPGPLTVSPQSQGEYVTRLILQQGALQRQLQQEKQARGQGKAGLLSGLQINTPAFSAPQPAASPGSILSDPYGWNDGGL